MKNEPYRETFFSGLPPERQQSYLVEFKRGFHAGLLDLPRDAMADHDVSTMDLNGLFDFFRRYPGISETAV